jgi:hypothetical protein
MKKAKTNVVTIEKRTFPTEDIIPALPEATFLRFELIVVPTDPIFARRKAKRSFQSKPFTYHFKNTGSPSASTPFAL